MESLDGEPGRKKRRRSERLAELDSLILAERTNQHNTENRSSSAPKQRPSQLKPFKRRSAPASHSGRVPLAEIIQQGQWASLQEDLLVSVVQRVAPQTASIMRLVCHSWKRAVDQGLLRLQSDSAWDNNQLSKVQRTFPSLAVLDLHLSVKTSVPEPLQHMKSLRHLRICKNSHLAQAEWTRTLAKLRQLHTLALPGCSSLTRINLGGYKHIRLLDLTACSHLAHITTPTMLPCLLCLNLRECQSLLDWKAVFFLMQFLEKMPNLEALDLSYCCQIGDKDMEALALMPRLHRLVLMHCRNITNTGLACLSLSTAMRHVYIDGCSMISEQGIKVMEITSPQINFIKFSL